MRAWFKLFYTVGHIKTVELEDNISATLCVFYGVIKQIA